jgi:hypothetical protein
MNLGTVVGQSRDEVKNNLTAEVQVASTRLHLFDYSQTDFLQHKTSSLEAACLLKSAQETNVSTLCSPKGHILTLLTIVTVLRHATTALAIQCLSNVVAHEIN